MVYMGMNIKNAETQRLVQDLAAITEAVRERLDRLRREHGTGLAGLLLAIGRDCAPRLKEPFRSAQHGDLLYDDSGLPR